MSTRPGRVAALTIWIGSVTLLVVLELTNPQNRPGVAILFGAVFWIAIDYYEMRLGANLDPWAQFIRTNAKMSTVITGAFFGVGWYQLTDASMGLTFILTLAMGVGVLVLVKWIT